LSQEHEVLGLLVIVRVAIYRNLFCFLVAEHQSKHQEIQLEKW